MTESPPKSRFNIFVQKTDAQNRREGLILNFEG
jgi:hypothetical protein